jgi:dihydroorotate dehydrogenase (NAD+) catalytic subunit
MCSFLPYWSMKSALLSTVYRGGRSLTISSVYALQGLQRRSRDLEDVVSMGDMMLKNLPAAVFRFPIPQGIGAHLYDLSFPSPLTIASFKDDLVILDRWMMLGFGGAAIKTVMCEKRSGNPRPRLQEVHGGGFLNAMGLPCPGINGVLSLIEEHIRKGGIFRHRRPIGVSIGGSSQEEYRATFGAMVAFFSQVDCPHYYEINISCPNTPEGQILSGKPDLVRGLLAFMREKTRSVITVKLSQDMKDEELLSFADVAATYKNVALNLGNTAYYTCQQAGLPQEAISVGGGGLSGPSIYPRTLSMTKLIAPTGVKIIATGGIDSAEKVRELMAAGASIVGMASALVKDMFCIPRINYALARRPHACPPGIPGPAGKNRLSASGEEAD